MCFQEIKNIFKVFRWSLCFTVKCLLTRIFLLVQSLPLQRYFEGVIYLLFAKSNLDIWNRQVESASFAIKF